MSPRYALWGCLCSGMLLAVPVAAFAAAAPTSHDSAGATKMHAQLQQVDAKIATAHTRHSKLQSQVSKLEQQNAARKQQLQQRDTEIATLKKKLAAAAPASTTSAAGH